MKTQIRMNKKRLEELIKVLKAVKSGPHRKWDMSTWFIAEARAPKITINAKKGVCVMEEGFCHTSACALGHAALHPAFQKAGLSLEIDTPLNLNEGIGATAGTIKFKDHEDVHAGEAFFGISHAQAIWLFDPSKYAEKMMPIKPRHVIARIKQILAGKDAYANE